MRVKQQEQGSYKNNERVDDQVQGWMIDLMNG